MALTWKDGVTTLLALVVLGFTYLTATGYTFPFISGFRWATTFLLVVGIGMCALSGADPANSKTIWATLATILGVLSLVIIIAGIVTGTKALFIAAAGTIVLLWIMTTLHHIIGR